MPSIPKLLSKNLKKQKQLGFHTLVLTRIAVGTPNPADITGPPIAPAPTTHPCSGRVDDMQSRYWQFWQNAQTGTMSRTTFVGFVILGATLPAGITPRAGDTITSKGRVYTIAADGVGTVQLDTPAMHMCACRAPGG